MTIRSAWAYNNGKRTMNHVRAAVASMEAEKKEKFQEELPKLIAKRDNARARQERRDGILWEDLKAGDTLERFGLPHIVVAKKNKKSIITTTGTKLTRGEVINSI